MADRMRYTDLIVWQRGMDLVVRAYTLSQDLPAHERFGLVAQIRRAAVSVPANVAEGHGRLHRGDYIHHLSIASGSLCELQTLALASARLGYVADRVVGDFVECTNDLGRMLSALIRRLRHAHPLSPIPS